MPNKPNNGKTARRAALELKRVYETAPDHVTAYIDHVNLVSAGTEIILSGYQTIPGYPQDERQEAYSSRRATLILHPQHAVEVGELLVKHGRALLEQDKRREGKK